jgi:sialidase-1
LKYVKSKDNGKSWEPPVDITNQISKSAWHKDFKFITSGRGIQTKAGKLLHTLVNLDNGLHLFGSDDHGESWYLLDAHITPADESKVVELEDGSWMINSRLNGSGIRYVHISEDDGKTWLTKPDSSLIDPGCNASLVKYTANSPNAAESFLLFSNANSPKDRQNLSVRVSFDEGESWSEGKTIYGGSAAYSSMTILSNGDIGVIFEKDDYTSIAFARFTPGWLLH